MKPPTRGSWLSHVCVPALVLALTAATAFGQRRDGVPAVPPPERQVVLRTAEVLAYASYQSPPDSRTRGGSRSGATATSW